MGISRFHCSRSSCQCFPFYPPWILLSNFPVAVWANHYRAQLERKNSSILTIGLVLRNVWIVIREEKQHSLEMSIWLFIHISMARFFFLISTFTFCFLHCFDGGVSICSKVFHIKKVAHFIGFFFPPKSKDNFVKKCLVSPLGFSVKVNHFIPERTQSMVVKNWRKSWKWITEGAGKSIIIVNLNQSLLLQKDSRLIFIGAHAYNFKKEKKKGDRPNRTMTTNFHPMWN